MAHKHRPIRFTCELCGSTNLRHEAWATWNPESQSWELDHVFDEARCEDCDERVNPVIATLDPGWKPDNRAVIPSGLGGSFTVKLLRRTADGHWRVMVDMPGNPDFHGWAFGIDESKLKTVEAPR